MKTSKVWICLIAAIIYCIDASFAVKEPKPNSCGEDELVKKIQIGNIPGKKDPNLAYICGPHKSKGVVRCNESKEGSKQILINGKRSDYSCRHKDDSRTIYKSASTRNKIRVKTSSQCSVKDDHVSMLNVSHSASSPDNLKFHCNRSTCSWDCEKHRTVIKSGKYVTISADEIYKSKYIFPKTTEKDEKKVPEAFFSIFEVSQKSKTSYEVNYRVCRDCHFVPVPIVLVISGSCYSGGCFHDTPECLNTDESVSKSVTKSGVPCQQWSLDTPHAHNNNHLPGKGCINQGSQDFGAWCYTTGSTRWEYCFNIC